MWTARPLFLFSLSLSSALEGRRPRLQGLLVVAKAVGLSTEELHEAAPRKGGGFAKVHGILTLGGG